MQRVAVQSALRLAAQLQPGPVRAQRPHRNHLAATQQQGGGSIRRTPRRLRPPGRCGQRGVRQVGGEIDAAGKIAPARICHAQPGRATGDPLRGQTVRAQRRRIRRAARGHPFQHLRGRSGAEIHGKIQRRRNPRHGRRAADPQLVRIRRKLQRAIVQVSPGRNLPQMHVRQRGCGADADIRHRHVHIQRQTQLKIGAQVARRIRETHRKAREQRQPLVVEQRQGVRQLARNMCVDIAGLILRRQPEDAHATVLDAQLALAAARDQHADRVRTLDHQPCGRPRDRRDRPQPPQRHAIRRHAAGK